MSIEAHVIAAIIEDGTPKKAFQAGISKDDFRMYDEEWDWLLAQLEGRRPINWRRFQQAFPEFERVVLDERLQDLCVELKNESAYEGLVAAIDEVGAGLEPENTLERATMLHEILSGILRTHLPQNEIMFSEAGDYLKRQKELILLRENGQTPGIPTRIKGLDVHYGGLRNGRTILVLGRPGDAKSMLQAYLCCAAFLDGRRGGLFSPEMNEDEHRARIATLLSAFPEVQEALGLSRAFRNRDILDGRNYNYKTYKRFWKWYEEQPGEIVLFNRQNRKQKMSPSYIDARVDDYGLEYVVVDPLYKMKSGLKNLKGWEELQAITDQVCDIAEIHNIPVIMSNQAGRSQGNRGDAPHKDSSFNGDSPVQEADHVIGVMHQSEEKKLILRCTKNRHGQDFRIDCRFLPNIGVLEDMTTKDQSYYYGREDGSGAENDDTKSLEGED